MLNGGIETIEQVDDALLRVDGVMIGRKAYHQPYFLAELQRVVDPDWQAPSRGEVVDRMLPYIEREVAAGTLLHKITRHMLGLFAGQPGARSWRRYISEHAHRDGAGTEVLVNALSAMPATARTFTMAGPEVARTRPGS